VGPFFVFIYDLRLDDVDDLLPHDVVVVAGLALCAELDFAFLEGEEGIILAHANVLAREDRGASLSDNDLTRGNVLAMIDLHT